MTFHGIVIRRVANGFHLTVLDSPTAELPVQERIASTRTELMQHLEDFIDDDVSVLTKEGTE